MRIIAASTDIILLARIRAVLEEDGVPVFELDAHTSSAEGSLGILPRRLAVPESLWPKAHACLDRENLLDALP